MKSAATYFLLLVMTMAVNAFGQNETGIVMTSFIPKSNAYDIYYPKSFLLEEDGGIVTIYDSITGLNITVSSYSLDKKMNDESLIEILNGFLKSYFKKEIAKTDWNSYLSKFDNLVELRITHEQTNWIWWGITGKKRMVVLSINKEDAISSEDVELVRSMIDTLIINK